MKRHPGLEPLSDDHHRALVLARSARRAGETARDRDALATLWEQVRQRFALDLEPHFRAEETVLFPALAAAGERALVERALEDHAELRRLVRAAADAEGARAFGRRLHDHVRFEERELFPHAERVLPDLVLDATGRAARGG